MRKTAIYSALLLSGCVTRPAPVPWPCSTIREVPGLREEMKALRSADDVRQQLRMMPASATVRAYAKASSAKCAADRELGAQPLTEPTPSAWARAWRWVVHLFE